MSPVTEQYQFDVMVSIAMSRMARRGNQQKPRSQKSAKCIGGNGTVQLLELKGQAGATGGGGHGMVQLVELKEQCDATTGGGNGTVQMLELKGQAGATGGGGNGKVQLEEFKEHGDATTGGGSGPVQMAELNEQTVAWDELEYANFCELTCWLAAAADLAMDFTIDEVLSIEQVVRL